jgi:hypothetical protein
MESSGRKNQIHCSQSTAALLIGAGKEQWITPRKEHVNVKGTGLIQTYWIRRSMTTSSHCDSEQPSSDTDLFQSVPSKAQQDTLPIEIRHDLQQTMPSRKIKRLVEWQTAVLSKLLRNVVAKRNEMQVSSDPVANPENVLEKRIPLDEVAEILKLPQFDQSSGGNEETEYLELDPVVENELEAFIGAICSKYNENRTCIVIESLASFVR